MYYASGEWKNSEQAREGMQQKRLRTTALKPKRKMWFEVVGLNVANQNNSLKSN